MLTDLRLAARTLARAPLLTAVAVLSLALGIGANAALFSLFEQLLLRPLPVAHPNQLVNLSAPGPSGGTSQTTQAGDEATVFSAPMFRDLAAAGSGPGTRLVGGVAAHRGFTATLAAGGRAQPGEGMLVSGSYFPTLGLQPALGRLLGPGDDQGAGAPSVAVLAYDYWVTRLGRDPGVLARPLVVNGHPLTIVGVAPPGFTGTTLGVRPQVFVPLPLAPQMLPWANSTTLADRRTSWVYVFARLAPGVSAPQAGRALSAVYRRLLSEVEAPAVTGLSAPTLARFRAKQLVLADGRRGQSTLHGAVRTPLLLLFAISGMVLLIACANIANLLLARGAGRHLELTLRRSLGATRRRIVAQLLTEAGVLAALGGAASVGVAAATLALVRPLLPADPAATLDLGLRAPTVLFATALAAGTGLLFGLVPALQSTRPDLVTVIRSNAGQIAGGRTANRFRTGLVTGQIALAMTLLVAAGLLLTSLRNIGRVDLGLGVEHVVTFGLAPELTGYTPERSRALFARVEDAFAAVPGVTGVTASVVPVLTGAGWAGSVSVEGFTTGPDADPQAREARVNMVGPGYFQVMRVPLLAGRDFTPGDREGTPRVAVVNEAFARKFGLGRTAVGKRLGMGPEPDIAIVGVARNAKYSAVKDTVPAVFFVPYRQQGGISRMTFYVRAAGAPARLLRQVPAVLAGLAPDLPVTHLTTLPDVARENVALDRLTGVLAAAFAALATLLAAVGLYGVLAYTVAQRTREIGVRMALGASGARVRGLVLRQVGGMLLAGGLGGCVAALGLGRAAQSLLFGLGAADPAVLAAASGVLALTALVAGYLPAQRAARVPPMRALRHE